ncbi:MAG: type IV toxin-antitoxin system AbiEi family antitoxin domain-containing protein [Actinomycetia bacterium]|nr:type IV toxin-antitoxin system AbiEi family antitoxin domain-containing protein [Actinomycetes bacterium]
MSDGAGISGSGRAELASVVARGRRLVSVIDVAAALAVDRTAAAKKLARWADQGWFRRVRRGLYIPVPLEAERPGSWSEDPLLLADAVWEPCYFTGWTAASQWGLTEQIFRSTVLKTGGRVRVACERLLDHEYLLGHISQQEMVWGMRPIWRGERRVRMADPARTVIDILDSPALGGGIRHGAEILEAYLEESDWQTLVEYGDRLGNRAVFKRLGYLLEAAELGHIKLVAECQQRISKGISLLDPGAPASGPRVSRWRLRANVVVTRQGAS